MGRGPRYRRPFRRRLEGKTDYHKRLKLLKSRKLRVVIRTSNNHMRVQIVQSTLGGDKVLISAFSKELPTKYGWSANTGNIPASYLTGYLAGLRAKNNNIQEAIFDLGMFYKRNRVLATCKGVIDAGLKIPYNEEFFPDDIEDRIMGKQIESYAEKLKSEDPEKYEQIFSGYLKSKKVNPLKISQIVSDSIKMIENNA
ncbi:MAG: 50S ribosomal protein L18 [Promethearchaeota archaeon]|jgi:large subunit ribosomal protein L18